MWKKAKMHKRVKRLTKVAQKFFHQVCLTHHSHDGESCSYIIESKKHSSAEPARVPGSLMI